MREPDSAVQGQPRIHLVLILKKHRLQLSTQNVTLANVVAAAVVCDQPEKSAVVLAECVNPGAGVVLAIDRAHRNLTAGITRRAIVRRAWRIVRATFEGCAVEVVK